MVLVAGGIGATPLLSIAAKLALAGHVEHPADHSLQARVCCRSGSGAEAAAGDVEQGNAAPTGSYPCLRGVLQTPL